MNAALAQLRNRTRIVYLLVAIPVIAFVLVATAPPITTAYARSTSAAGATIVVTHKVADFDKWKVGYDATNAWKPKFGWKQGLVLTSDGDRNNVTVVEDFDTLENAKRFASSPDLKAAMSKAGVMGPPDIRFFNTSARAKP